MGRVEGTLADTARVASGAEIPLLGLGTWKLPKAGTRTLIGSAARHDNNIYNDLSFVQ
jgi:hypothetical protein